MADLTECLDCCRRLEALFAEHGAARSALNAEMELCRARGGLTSAALLAQVNANHAMEAIERARIGGRAALARAYGWRLSPHSFSRRQLLSGSPGKRQEDFGRNDWDFPLVDHARFMRRARVACAISTETYVRREMIEDAAAEMRLVAVILPMSCWWPGGTCTAALLLPPS